MIGVAGKKDTYFFTDCPPFIQLPRADVGLQGVHGKGHDDWIRVRYLPVFGHPTYLRYRPKRYRCEYCDGQPTTTQRLDWHEPNSPNTYAYEEHILLQLVNSTVEDVAIKEKISYDRVLGILERHISEQVDWTVYTRLGVLGLDEIGLSWEFR